MSLTNYNYPHLNIDVIDNSVVNATPNVYSQLHVPFFPIFASLGESYKLFYGTGAEIKEVFGDDVFNMTGQNATHSNIFAAHAVGYQAVCVVRVNGVSPPAVNGATLQITAESSSKGATLTALTYTETLTFTNPQFAVNYTTRELSGSGGNYKLDASFLLFKLVARSGGSTYNQYGIRLKNIADGTTNELKDNLYELQVVKNTPSGVLIVKDNFGNNSRKVALTSKSRISNGVNWSITTQIKNNYNVPFDIVVNDSALQNIFNDLKKVNYDNQELQLRDNHTAISFFDGRLGGTTDPKQTWSGGIGDASAFNAANILSNAPLMLKGGTDSNDFDNPNASTNVNYRFDQAVSRFLDSDIPELYDQFRYPFTHFYDSGYSATIKNKLTKLYSIRDDLVIDFSTFSLVNPDNENSSLVGGDEEIPPATYEQDISQAAQIAIAATTPESELYGTGFMRGNIFGQSGTLASNSVPYQLPYTLNTLVLRCKYHSGTSITGQFTPRPNNEITIFKDISYVLSIPEQKENAWINFLNLASYADTEVKFYPDFKSMYKIGSSILSSTSIVDYIVYIKKIIRNQWTFMTGSTAPVSSMFTDIENAIDRDIHYAFNSILTSKTSVTQTVADRVNGHSVSINCEVFSGSDINIWNVIIPVSITTDNSGNVTSYTSG